MFRLGRMGSQVSCGALVVVATWLVAECGWRAHAFGMDLIPAARAAIDFVRTGKLPEKSCLSSTCGYNPPGTSWLLLPGIVMFRDPRLFEAPGTLALHAITVAGLITTASLLSTVEVGFVTVLLYSVGPVGLFFCASLWPRSPPAFSVWTLAFLLLYLKSNRSYYFGLAILTFGAGLFVFLEMAPMGVAFLAALFLQRSRKLVFPAVASAMLVIAIWVPYLRFEGTRGYEDLSRLLLRKSCPVVQTDAYNWCSGEFPVYETGTNRLVVSTVAPSTPAAPLLRRLGGRLLGDIAPAFAVNWRQDVTGIPAGDTSGTRFELVTALRSVLFVLGLITIFKRGEWTALKWQSSRRCLVIVAGVCALLFGVGLRPELLSLFTRSGALSEHNHLAAYSAEAIWLGVLTLLIGCSIRRGWDDDPTVAGRGNLYRLLLTTYAMSWGFWALLGGDSRYFLWLWPIQALIMGVGLVSIASMFRKARIFLGIRYTLLTVGILLMAANVTLTSQLTAWVKGSWSGEDSPDLAILDRVAEDWKVRHAQKSETIRILYETAFRDWTLMAGTLDHNYEPGMVYDFYLQQRYGLRNESQ